MFNSNYYNPSVAQLALINVYTCNYIYVYIYTRDAYIYIYIFYTFIQLYIHTIHTYIHTSIHTYIHTCIRPYLHTSIHPSMHACMHPCIHLSIHPWNPYIHPYIHTHTYTWVDLSDRLVDIYIYIYIVHSAQLSGAQDITVIVYQEVIDNLCRTARSSQPHRQAGSALVFCPSFADASEDAALGIGRPLSVSSLSLF